MRRTSGLAGGLRALAGVFVASAFGGQALAADFLEGPAAATWSGAYVGAVAGSAKASTVWRGINGNTAVLDLAPRGGLVGVTAGVNRQTGLWVLGVEGDFAWADLNDTIASGCIGGPCRAETNWLSTARLRLGAASGALLVYGTGGLAFGLVDIAAPGIPAHESQWHIGWAAGFGAELAIAPRVTLKAEWLHYDLAERVHHPVPYPPLDVGEGGQILRVGINWRL
ncbi:MAG: outer membrane beta-barrel protein [Bauldia sp.]